MSRSSFRNIKSEMLRRIAEQEWRPGALIPGEEALAAEFGAARATVNRALQELARSGILERKRKAGTRVALHPVREARFSIPLVRQEVEACGAAYAYRLLSRAVGPAPEQATEKLGLPEDTPLLHLECLHLADGAPYQFEDRYIHLEAVPEAADESFAEIGPNEWLVNRAPFSHAEFTFFAAAASPREAELLGTAPGAALFVAERLTWLLDKPVTHVRMTHPPGHRMVTML